MTEFLSFFENLTAGHKLVWIVICLSLHWIVEAGFPLFKHEYRKVRHAATNLALLLCSMIINTVFGLVTLGIFAWSATNQIGLLYLFDLPVWAELLIAVMLMDFFGQYVIHYLLHKVRFMWRFHMVHHSDSHVDATTGTRHHPGDYLMREVMVLGVIILSGAPLSYYLFYRITTVFFAYFSHVNFSLPLWLDKALSWVIITPNMHKFHHHFERPWTDSNYGNVFSFWDRIFGTLVYDDPKKVRFGLDVLDDSKDEDLMYQLKIPFNKEIKTDT